MRCDERKVLTEELTSTQAGQGPIRPTGMQANPVGSPTEFPNVMQNRTFGFTGLGASMHSLGTWALGEHAFSWSVVRDRTSPDTITRALDHGVNLLDTVAICGSGYAERLLGQAFPTRRSQRINRFDPLQKNLGSAGGSIDDPYRAAIFHPLEAT